MTSQPKPFDPGFTVSEGTLRTSDLLKAFTDALKSVEPDNTYVAEADELLAKYGDFGYTHELYTRLVRSGMDRTDASNIANDLDYLVNEALYWALDVHSPSNCYFGSHPGDGALFGYWYNQDTFDDEVTGNYEDESIGSHLPADVLKSLSIERDDDD